MADIFKEAYELPPGEAKLLSALFESFPEMLPHNRDRLNKGSRKVWVCNLRKKIRPDGLGIKNIKARGYQLVEVRA